MEHTFRQYVQITLLVWDMHHSRLTDSNKNQLAQKNTETAIILGGLISLIQPPDDNLNKPFNL